MPFKYILIGAKPPDSLTQNPGGQLTASLGLLSFAAQNNLELKIIDTTQSSFPVPPFRSRLKRAIKRIFLLIWSLKSFNIKGVIIFASSGFSFYERICLSIICRLFHVKDFFFVRSGHFIMAVEKSIFSRFLARILLMIPWKIGAQGSSWIDFYKKIGIDPKRTSVIHNWVPQWINISEKPKCKPFNRELHFIFVGWLVIEKGVLELLEAISILRDNYKFHFTFVGGGTLEQQVRNRINKDGWDKEIEAVGWKRSEEIQHYLNIADVFVLPSYAEGFPNALLEAMANGMPAICSDVGGVCDSIHDKVNGYLIRPRNVQDIMEAMKNYIVEPKLIELHSRATLDVVKNKHDLNTNCGKVFNAFN